MRTEAPFSWIMVASLAAQAVILSATTQAGPLMVAGSPTYDPTTSIGLKDGGFPHTPGRGVNNAGTAVGYATKYIDGTDMGLRAVRWDASGTAAVELGTLGTSSTGSTNTYVCAINDAGVAVGHATRYVNGRYRADRAVRWDPSNMIAVELGNLGTDSSGYTNSDASDINDAGIAVGSVIKYVNGTSKGSRAVRWDASGTVATELGNLGTDIRGCANVGASAVNDNGTVVGSADQYVSGNYMGTQAVRWDAGGTVATELGNLGTNSSGPTTVVAQAINNADTAIGYATKYVNGTSKGLRAVRWDASGTVATELGNLGTDESLSTDTEAFVINDAGTVVGYAEKYVNRTYKGLRAVRWDASGTAAVELGTLGTSSSDSTYAIAYDINEAGMAIGYANKFVNGISKGAHAVIWLPDASVVDLNDLGVAPVPAGGDWTLSTAETLSADGWVAGKGVFDPDGAGSEVGYTRLWVTQVGLGGNWTNAAGGTWGRGPNWSTGTPAMQVGTATFNLPAAYTVALDRNELTKSVTVTVGVVTIGFNGHTLSTEEGLSITAGAQLVLDESGTGAQLASDVSGDGSVTKSGPGTVTLLGNNSYTGGTMINSGTMVIGSAGALPAGKSLSIGSGGTLILGGGTSLATLAQPVPEPSTLALVGSGILGLLGFVWRRRSK